METHRIPIEKELENLLEDVLGDDERTKEVMYRHNGFNCRGLEKLQDIAKDMGVTKEAVRQRSIKGVDQVCEALRNLEVPEKALTNSLLAAEFLKLLAPCSEKDAQMALYNESATDLQDFDLASFIYMLESINAQPGLAVIKEGSGQFLVHADHPHTIKQIIKKAREEVTHNGAGDIVSLANQVATGHQLIDNQVRCIASALEAQPDFVWLTKGSLQSSRSDQRVGYFLLKNAGRNPVELRLKRIFSVRDLCHEQWVHAKYTRSRKAMQIDVDLPVEAIRQIGIEKGICEPTKDPHILRRARKLDPKKELLSFEYRLWEFLKENPNSRDSEILEACQKRKADQYNVRSKLNFSVVIQRVGHGVYTAVTDEYPPLAQTSIEPLNDKSGEKDAV